MTDQAPALRPTGDDLDINGDDIAANGSPDALLTAALAAAQGQFPSIPKSSTANVQGKDGKPGYTYSYAELGDVLGAVRPVLSAHGLALTQPTKRESGKLVLRTTLRHIGGGELVSELDLAVAPSNPQAFGGSLTYLRRYEACTLLGIAPEDDRDAQDVPAGGGSRPAPAPVTPAWAAAADTRAVRTRLTELIGNVAAGELLEAIADYSGGSVPRVAARAILGALARLEAFELIPHPPVVADTARDQQDAAAEQPDPPAPEATDAEPEPAAAMPPGDDPIPTPDERPPAGSVRADDLPHDPAKQVAALRALGCTCTDPLGDPKQADDGCPISGHGIPF